jgi:AcrR family transcriptional regulator
MGKTVSFKAIQQNLGRKRYAGQPARAPDKKLLKDSLIRLLQQGSIHRISVREICDRAGINRTTFYKYYGSQYDLLGDMENACCSRWNGIWTAEGRRRLTPRS